jgi:hypothetical protein
MSKLLRTLAYQQIHTNMAQANYHHTTDDPSVTTITVTGCTNCPFNQCFDEVNEYCTHPENDQPDRPLEYESDIELTHPPTMVSDA